MGIDLCLKQFKLGLMQGAFILNLFLNQAGDMIRHLVKTLIQNLEFCDVGLYRLSAGKIPLAELFGFFGERYDRCRNAAVYCHGISDNRQEQPNHGDHCDPDQNGAFPVEIHTQPGQFLHFIMDKIIHIVLDECCQTGFTADVPVQQLHPFVIGISLRDLDHIGPQIGAHIEHALKPPLVVRQRRNAFKPCKHSFGVVQFIHRQLCNGIFIAGLDDMVVHGQVQIVFEFFIKISRDHHALHRIFVAVVDGKQHDAEHRNHNCHHDENRQKQSVDLLSDAFFVR